MIIIHSNDVKNIENYLEEGCVVVTWRCVGDPDNWESGGNSEIIQYEYQDSETKLFYGKSLIYENRDCTLWFDSGNIELIIKEK